MLQTQGPSAESYFSCNLGSKNSSYDVCTPELPLRRRARGLERCLGCLSDPGDNLFDVRLPLYVFPSLSTLSPSRVFFHTHALNIHMKSNLHSPVPSSGSAQYAWNFNETVWSDPELRAAISFEQPFAATDTLNHTVCFHGGKECRFETWLLCAQDQGIDKVNGKTRRGGAHHTCSLTFLVNPGRSTAVCV